VLVGVLAVASVALFVTYDDDPLPAEADAVVVLAGSDVRLPVALRLMKDGVAPTLVVSDGFNDEDEERRRLCTGPPTPYTLVCRKPDPYSTRGEARMIRDLARARGWDSIVVVTSRYHLLRTRMLVGRCYGGDLAMRGASDAWWYLPIASALEWAKLGFAEVVRDC
jgi:uncharacterized SAM-binding protein YcdF (DUF218 family)